MMLIQEICYFEFIINFKYSLQNLIRIKSKVQIKRTFPVIKSKKSYDTIKSLYKEIKT